MLKQLKAGPARHMHVKNDTAWQPTSRSQFQQERFRRAEGPSTQRVCIQQVAYRFPERCIIIHYGNPPGRFYLTYLTR